MIDQEVLSYDHNIIDESYILSLRSTTLISSTGNEEDVMLESCVVDERVCIHRPKEVLEEYFIFIQKSLKTLKSLFHLPTSN